MVSELSEFITIRVQGFTLEGAPRNHHVEQGSHEERGSYIRLHHNNFLSLGQPEFWTGSLGWQ